MLQKNYPWPFYFYASIINAEIVKVEQLQNFPDIQPGGDSFVWIKSCSNSNNFSLCICAKYQLFFLKILSIVISFQSKCFFLLTIICGAVCCIYIISQFTCCKVSIYNKWIVICGAVCCIYIISQFTCWEYTTNHNPLVVYRHLTTGELWYNVYTTDCTTNHNPLVVYRHLTTGELWYNVNGLWFVVYSVVYTLYHNPHVVRWLYTTSGL
jgi:hypothetical protein